jgi:hypothetical protein
MTQVNEPLLELFRAHGVEAAPCDDWIAFPGRAMRANASIVKERQHQGGLSVQLQLDLRLEITSGGTIVESFAGVGAGLARAPRCAILP